MKPWEFPGLSTWKARETKERGKPRLVTGRFNKQGNLPMRLVLGGLYPPAIILRIFIKLLAGSVTYSVQIVSTTHYSLKVMPSKWLLV